MPQPDLTPNFQGSISVILDRERKLLELLFDDPGLNSLRARVPTHPAVIKYEKLAEFLLGDHSVRYPDELDQVSELGSAALDNMTIAADLSPESVLAAIDDPEVLLQLRKRATNPDQFIDQMAAFTCWNLLQDKKIKSSLVEKNGLPDILVSLPSGAQEWIECKRIRLGSQPTRLRKVLKKANHQIKRAELDGVGAVYIFIERPQHKTVLDDALPDEISTYLAEIERELSASSLFGVGRELMTAGDRVHPFVRRKGHPSVPT